MEAHGGYICRLEELEAHALAELAKQALIEDGADPSDCSLLVSLLPRPRVLRLAYDAPYTYGKKGARWYEHHHALARLLSKSSGLTVHAYVFDPDELEQVTGYGAGRKVGGETMRYEDAELPDDEELDDLAFERMKARWPLGHLAKVLGVAREELLRIVRADTVLIELDGSAPRRSIAELFVDRVPSFRRELPAAEAVEPVED